MSSLSNFEEFDQAIEAMIATPEQQSLTPGTEIADLVELASQLRQLPRPEFKSRLKAELEWVASARPLSTGRSRATEARDILPSLFGNGDGMYPIRSGNFLASAALHAVAVALVLAFGVMAFHAKPKTHAEMAYRILSVYLPAHGGGGGGDAGKLNASKGSLPRAATEQLTPPVVVMRNLDPKLRVDPSVIAPDLQLPQTSQLGDPLSRLMESSNGTGVRSGIGSGSKGGVGSGGGPGYRAGIGGNYGGEAFHAGGGISEPRAIYSPEPEYSPEARAAKYQGTVVLWAVIAMDGRPHDVRVQRSLGMGLDEKAIEAVRTWRFEPAMQDGHAVPVMMEIEVSFHLY